MENTSESQWQKYSPFPSLRGIQNQAITEIIDFFESKPFEQQMVILDAPTGVGKSLIGYIIAMYYADKYQYATNYVTNNKYLEKQIIHDFEQVKPTFGRNNFTCLLNQLSASFGECTKSQHAVKKGNSKENLGEDDFKCKHKPVFQPHSSPIEQKIGKKIDAYETYGIQNEFTPSELTTYFQHYQSSYEFVHRNQCPYWKTKIEAINSHIAIHNYSYYILENNYVGSFKRRYLLICDEGHKLEDILINFVKFQITYNDIEMFNLPISLSQKSFTQWKDDVTQCLDYIRGFDVIENITRYGEQIYGSQSEAKQKLEVEKLMRKRDALEEKLSIVSQVSEDIWVIEYLEDKKNNRIESVIFSPIHARDYMYKYLLGSSVKIIVMSATILDKEIFLRTMGDDFEEMDYEGNVKYLALDSPFPLENRLINYIPTAKITYYNKHTAIDQMLPVIRTILAKFPNDKGILHTKSYDLANLVTEKCNNTRMLLHSSKNRESVIQKFIDGKSPYVLVSPAIEEGLDLKDDLCRFVIVLKIPFLNLGDPKIKKRLEEDEEWYYWKKIQTIIQESGRGVRHDKDYCITYILDETFNQILGNYRYLFPKWFNDAIIEENVEDYY